MVGAQDPAAAVQGVLVQVPGRLHLPQVAQVDGCYRPRYLNIQRLNYLWTIRHSSARIAGNMIT